MPASDAVNTFLFFGSSTFGTPTQTNLTLSANFAANSITFGSAAPHYYFSSTGGSVLSLGAGGITLQGNTSSFIDLSFGFTMALLANQTWNTGGNLSAYGNISGTGFGITKTGAGYLALGGSNTFTGGVTVSAGTLYLASTTGAGTGTITLAGGTTLSTLFGNLTVANPVSLTGGASISIPSNATMQFSGAIGQDASARALTISGGGQAILSGASSYTGGTNVVGSAVVFKTAASLPATGSITGTSATNSGVTSGAYVGVGTSGLLATAITKIASPSTYNGSLGFDTDPAAANPATFSDALNLSSFGSNFAGLGSFSRAIFGSGGTLTIGNNQSYKFSGGGGILYFNSPLTAFGTNNVVVTSSTATTGEDDHLTVVLQGANNFTGSVSVTESSLIFDSALPSTTAYILSDDGYLGYTQGAGLANFAAFLGKVTGAGSSRSSDAIIGLDTNTGSARVVTDAFDLSGISPVFFGTSTKLTIDSGSSVRPPSGGRLFLTGSKGGYLKITAPLFSGTSTISVNGNSVTTGGITGGIQVGFSESEPGDVSYKGYVELANATSTYTGGTTLQSGYLIVGGGSSTGTSGSVTAGPLGTGALTVSGSNDSGVIALATSFDNLTLHNNISLATQLQVGVPATSTTTDFAFPLQSFQSNSLTLAGVISGSGALNYVGGGTLTLSGSNTFTGDLTINAGQVSVSSDANLGATYILTGANTFAGGTTINAGTLVANNATGSATGSGSITIAANAFHQHGQHRLQRFRSPHVHARWQLRRHRRHRPQHLYS